MSEIVSINRGTRMVMLAGAVALGLSACSLPPLHRSATVETSRSAGPGHASGQIRNGRYTVARGDTLYSIAFRANVDYRQLARWNGIVAPYVIHPGQILRLSRPAGMTPVPPTVPVATTPGTTTGVPVFRPVTPVDGTAASNPPDAGQVGITPTNTVAGGTPASEAAGNEVVPVAGKPVSTSTAPAQEVEPEIRTGATRSVAGVTWSWPAGGQLLSGFKASDSRPGIRIAGKMGDPVRAAASGVVVYSGNGLVGYGELIIIKHNDKYLSAYGHNSKRLVKEGDRVKAGQMIAYMGSSAAPRVELEFQIRHKGKPVNPLNYLPAR